MAGIGEITIPVSLELSESTKKLIAEQSRLAVLEFFAELKHVIDETQPQIINDCTCAMCVLAKAIRG